jgi:hypothetical protein
MQGVVQVRDVRERCVRERESERAYEERFSIPEYTTFDFWSVPLWHFAGSLLTLNKVSFVSWLWCYRCVKSEMEACVDLRDPRANPLAMHLWCFLQPRACCGVFRDMGVSRGSLRRFWEVPNGLPVCRTAL